MIGLNLGYESYINSKMKCFEIKKDVEMYIDIMKSVKMN